LAGLAAAGADTVFTEAVATWAACMWHGSTWDPTAPLYVDGHKKPVYSDRCLPRSLVGRRGTILGCRSLTFVHDAAGHPLGALTERGDTHLTRSVPALVAQFERSTALPIGHLVIDREGMAADFLATLAEEGRGVTTLLRANQYRDLTSFTDVGAWMPLLTDAASTVLREVAPARYTIARPTAPDGHLALSVALIRDHRRRVPIPGAAPVWDAWDADLPLEVRLGKAPAHPLPLAPAIPTEATLIPIVSTRPPCPSTDLVALYRQRWVAQENSFKDWLIPLGLDINHGYQITAVVNSEVSRRRTALETRITTLDRWATKAEGRERRASARHLKWVGIEWKHQKEGYHALRRALMDLRDQGVAEDAYQATRTTMWAAYAVTAATHRAAIIRA
jgi:hypothetical protein